MKITENLRVNTRNSLKALLTKEGRIGNPEDMELRIFQKANDNIEAYTEEYNRVVEKIKNLSKPQKKILPVKRRANEKKQATIKRPAVADFFAGSSKIAEEPQPKTQQQLLEDLHILQQFHMLRQQEMLKNLHQAQQLEQRALLEKLHKEQQQEQQGLLAKLQELQREKTTEKK